MRAQEKQTARTSEREAPTRGRLWLITPDGMRDSLARCPLCLLAADRSVNQRQRRKIWVKATTLEPIKNIGSVVVFLIFSDTITEVQQVLSLQTSWFESN